jgi:hypothetical protein
MMHGTMNVKTTGMLSSTTVWRKQSEFVSSRQSGQIPAAVRIGFECRCNGQNVSKRTFQRCDASFRPEGQKLP